MEKYIGLKDGELFCKFTDKETAENDPSGESDYLLVLSEEDVETLKKWLA